MRSLDLVACHLVGDFLLQDNDMAMNKLTDARVRARHATWYCVPFVLAGVLSRTSLKRLAAFVVLVWITHFIIDSKRWLPNDEWAPGEVLSDQALHAVQLALLNRIVGRSRH